MLNLYFLIFPLISFFFMLPPFIVKLLFTENKNPPGLFAFLLSYFRI